MAWLFTYKKALSHGTVGAHRITIGYELYNVILKKTHPVLWATEKSRQALETGHGDMISIVGWSELPDELIEQSLLFMDATFVEIE